MKSNKLRKKHAYKVISVSIFCLVIIVGLTIFQPRTTDKVTNDNAQAASQVIWQQFDGDSQKSGNNTNESLITKSTVTSLKTLWQVPVASDGSPVYLSGVTTSKGVKNVVFITTTGGGIIAFDEATGTQLWSKTTSGGAGVDTSSPVIDPSHQFVYNYGKDGKVHKYDVGTGNEETSGRWPLTATIIPNVEKGSSALAISNTYLYVTTSAYVGDAGGYVGHIVVKNLSTGSTGVFNTLCANQKQLLGGNCSSAQSGVWSRPGAVMDPTTGNIFISSGNGPYAAPNNLGDSLIELTPNLSKVVDTYTPQNFQQLQADDADLGSTDVAIVPGKEIGVQGGKDNKIRVVNLKNLSGKGAPYQVGGELQTISVNCNIFAQPISWVDGSTTWVFVTDMCNDLYAYKVSGTTLQQAYKNSNGGSSPLMVNGMLFIQSSGTIKAVDATTGTVLWSGSVGSMHWQSPAVVNGHVFVIDKSNLTTFAGTNVPTANPKSPTLAGGTQVSTPTPTPLPGFNCLGSCLTKTPSQSVPTTTIPIPSTTVVPCATTQQSVVTAKDSSQTQAYHVKQRKPEGQGLLQQLIQLFITLFELILGQLEGTPCSPSLTNTTASIVTS